MSQKNLDRNQNPSKTQTTLTDCPLPPENDDNSDLMALIASSSASAASTASVVASAAAANLSAALGAPPSEKLSRDNHLFWKTQVLPALRGAQVIALLDGTDLTPPKTIEIEDVDKKKIMVPNQDYGLLEIRLS